MVTQDNSAAPVEQQVTDSGDLPPLQTEDSTPPEVLEQERQLLQNLNIGDSSEAAEADTPTPATENYSTEEQPATQPSDNPLVQQVPQANPEQSRTYTQDEFEKMQSSFGKQVAEAQRAAQEAAQRLESYDVSSEVEARVRQQESQLVPLIGQEEASKIARSPEQVRQITEAITSQRQLQQLAAQSQQQNVQTENFAKIQAAQIIAKENNLSEQQAETLLVAADPAGMEMLAKQLAPNNQGAVPPETQVTQLGTGRSSTAAPPDQQRITQSAMNKPATQWSESEYEALRRAAWGE